MSKKHQHGISRASTRRAAGRKWRHNFNSQLRQMAARKNMRAPTRYFTMNDRDAEQQWQQAIRKLEATLSNTQRV